MNSPICFVALQLCVSSPHQESEIIFNFIQSSIHHFKEKHFKYMMVIIFVTCFIMSSSLLAEIVNIIL